MCFYWLLYACLAVVRFPKTFGPVVSADARKMIVAGVFSGRARAVTGSRKTCVAHVRSEYGQAMRGPAACGGELLGAAGQGEVSLI